MRHIAPTQGDINTPPPTCEPAIVVAAAEQKMGAVMILLYNGANVKTTSLDGRTLLHVVCERGADTNIALANLLCELGLTLSDATRNGMMNL